MVGICGGYTTFSSFSLETLRLVQSGKVQTAFVYLLVSAVTADRQRVDEVMPRRRVSIVCKEFEKCNYRNKP